jgi:hypothetical protein
MNPLDDENAILAAMLEQAERLCQTRDGLMVGQYRYLAERIRALIELRETALGTQTPGS